MYITRYKRCIFWISSAHVKKDDNTDNTVLKVWDTWRRPEDLNDIIMQYMQCKLFNGIALIMMVNVGLGLFAHLMTIMNVTSSNMESQ